MRPGLSEITIGGVLISPFVGYALAALAVLVIARPLLGWLGLEHAFSAPPAALLSFYTVVLALLIIFC